MKKAISTIVFTGFFLASLGCVTQDDDADFEAAEFEDESVSELQQSENQAQEESVESGSEGIDNDSAAEESGFALADDYVPFDPESLIVLFDFDEATLSDKNVGILNEIAAGMKKDPLARVNIRGHADTQGPQDYNLKLSRKRATSIKNFLMEKGIPEHRFVTDFYGESEPVMQEHSVRAFKKNRRGDFKLYYEHNAFSK